MEKKQNKKESETHIAVFHGKGIRRNPKITRKELAEIIGITEDGIKFNINQLKEKGILKRIGPDKGGYWDISK